MEQMLLEKEEDGQMHFKMQTNAEQAYPQHTFEDHSKIETITPSESLLDFPLNSDSPRFSSPPQQEQQLLEEIG